MQSRTMLSALLLLKTIILSSQGFQYFSILPDVGAVKNQSVFNGIDADSNYIYVMGSMLIKEDSDSRKKLAGYMTWVFDYSGSLISGNMMKDSSLEKIVTELGYMISNFMTPLPLPIQMDMIEREEWICILAKY